MTTNVFNQDTGGTSADATGNDQNPGAAAVVVPTPYTSDLVGDDKKFKTVADLENGKTEADAFILKLQEEKAALQASLDKTDTVQDALDKLKNQQSIESNTSTAMDADTLSKLVAEQVGAIDANKTKDANVAIVNAKVIEVFGEKANEEIANKAKELGVSVAYLQEAAASSPKAFYNLVGIGAVAQVNTQTTPTGSFNSATLNQSNVGTKTDLWDNFEKLRREKPREYFTAKVQNELFAAKKAGLI